MGGQRRVGVTEGGCRGGVRGGWGEGESLGGLEGRGGRGRGRKGRTTIPLYCARIELQYSGVMWCEVEGAGGGGRGRYAVRFNLGSVENVFSCSWYNSAVLSRCST